MKKILGLDLGTNSIGWALVNLNFDKKEGEICGMGGRIIPMPQDMLGKFESGQSVSQTAERTGYRSIRKLYQRDNLRRERLHRILNSINFLPEHYVNSIDFDKKPGQFKNGEEVKLNYYKNDKGKYDFIYIESFNEMIKAFKAKGLSAKIPYDWTIYYLRTKALKQKISKEELAWIILNFNQKRGYYQLRGEEEKDGDKQKEYCVLKVKKLVFSEDEVKGNKLYDVVFENGWKYDRQTTKPEDWTNKTREFIVTTSIAKNGEVKRSFKAVDSEKDWIAIKKKTEQDIDKSKKTVGQFIYESLLDNPNQKIKGKLVKTIERKYYKEELRQILKTQCELHDELKDRKLYQICIEELYPRNEAHQNSIKDKDFLYLILEDIIFYQRPLKSKKSSISNCAYETRSYFKIIKENVNERIVEKKVKVTEGIKAIPKSNPLYQEFRLWQFIKNLKIYKKKVVIDGKTIIDQDITTIIFETEDDWVQLFDFLNIRKEIDQTQIIDYLVKCDRIPKPDKENYRWNYVEDKKYPCNETKAQIIARLNKINGLNPNEFLTDEIEAHLWHIIYSVKDKHEYKSALEKFAFKYKIDVNSFVEHFIKFPPFTNDYGAYSHKALKKLLPLMRRGKYWNENDIPEIIKQRAGSIIERLAHIGFDKTKIDANVADDDIQKQVLKSFAEFKDKSPIQGLNTFQACYLVYNRHSEALDSAKWNSPADITNYLNGFKQHSLRNPIVEKVVTETLRVVKDIWEYYGNGVKDFFNEIHIELGREMKNPAKKREQIAARNIENENTNQRIKQLLIELMNDDNVKGEIRPHSPSHQELLKIFEEGVYQNPNANYSALELAEVEKIRKNGSPNQTEIKKYKLWLEQGYRSPYTGEIIPLSKLFTTEYQIEHVIPQSRYFDNSMNNKVICESVVNAKPYKDNQTGYEFIKNNENRIVHELSTNNKTVKIFTLKEYEEHCNQYFKKNRIKLKNLLSEDIPEGFIERQMNDSRYISKLVKSLLSNIVKEENEQAVTSKNIIPVTGVITDKLKNDWALNDKWNELIAPRFIRMNEITNSTNFGYWDNKINAFRPTVPDDLLKGFNKKRIDHRHHAMDALTIACANRKHIQYLNALNSEKENYSLKDVLLIKNKQGHYTSNFKMPWENFPNDAKTALEKTVISFKQNLRVINKTHNKTWQWVEKNGKLKKELVKQTKGENWAIRKPLHKETVSGIVKVKIIKEVSFVNGVKSWKNLVDKELKNIIKKLINEGKDINDVVKHFKTNPFIKEGKPVNKLKIYVYTDNSTATRTSLTDKFTRKQLEKVTDSGIRSILENHLKNYIDEKENERFDLAFNPDGIEELNNNIIVLNNGVPHKPIYKVRVYEEGRKFIVGSTGNKTSKWVEAAKGTNLFFAIYWNEETQKREFETIPLNEVIEHQKQVAHLPKEERTPILPNPQKGTFLFSISPNDLVYVPTLEEMETPHFVDFNNLTAEQTNRIYKMVSSSGSECYFLQNKVANFIKTYDARTKIGEFGSLNKMELSLENIRIKECCWKLKVDCIGNIVGVNRGF